MKFQSKTSLALVLFASISCQHSAREARANLTKMVDPSEELRQQEEKRLEVDQGKLQGWLYYSGLLSQMNGRDLKIESDQLRRSLERRGDWEDELRLGLVQTAQMLYARSFQKALETFEPLLRNTSYSPELRLWLAQYHGQLQLSAQLEKELGEERRQRGELEAKLKALSKIELEMSQREKVDTVR